MRKTINLNEDLNGQPFRHVTSFLFLLCIFGPKSSSTVIWVVMLWITMVRLETLSPVGIFPTVRSSPGAQATGRIPRWLEESGRKERWGCSQEEAHKWRSIHGKGLSASLVLLGPALLCSISHHPWQPPCISLPPSLSKDLEPMDIIKQGHTPHCHIWAAHHRWTGRAEEETETNAAAQTQCHGCLPL